MFTCLCENPFCERILIIVHRAYYCALHFAELSHFILSKTLKVKFVFFPLSSSCKRETPRVREMAEVMLPAVVACDIQSQGS